MNPSLEIKLLREENDKFRKENRQLKEDFKLLLTKVASLEERLSHYENPKNSRNRYPSDQPILSSDGNVVTLVEKNC